jgi:hypothetical protein
MGPLEGTQKREKVKLYLTRNFRRHEVGPYLVVRRAGKSALMGPLEGPIGGLNRDPNFRWGAPRWQVVRGPPNPDYGPES